MKRYFLFFLFLCWYSITIGQWISNGPFGGNITCFANVGSNIFAGSAHGGIYKSSNSAGYIWTSVSYNGLADGNITSLVSYKNTLIAGTAHSGLFISNNMAYSWQPILNGPAAVDISGLILHNNTLFATSASKGVFLSNDSGVHWSSANSGIIDLKAICLASDSTHVLAGTSSKVYMSNNNGTSWIDASSGLPTNGLNCLTIKGNYAYAGTTQGVFVSPVANMNWSAFGGFSIDIKSLIVRNDTLYAASAASGMFFSPLSKASWSSMSSGLSNDSLNVIFQNKNNFIIGAKGPAIYAENVGSHSWIKSFSGINNVTINDICVFDSLIFCATGAGVSISKDFGKTYFYSNFGLKDSLNVTSIAFSGTVIFAGTKTKGIYLSNDTGRTWTSSNNSLGSLAVSKIQLTASKVFVATADGKVYSSQITYLLWTDISNGLPGGTPPSTFVVYADTLYLGYNGGGIFVNRPGNVWTNFSTGLPRLDVIGLGIGSGKIFAHLLSGGFLMSITDKPDWKVVNTTGLGSGFSAFSVSPTNRLIVAAKGGGFSSLDYGITWKPAVRTDNIPAFATANLIILSGKAIFFGFPFNAVYKSDLGIFHSASGIAVHQPIENFIIYPNPNRGTFQINQIRKAVQPTQIKIFDLTGKQKISFFTDCLSSIHTGLTPGIYSIQIISENDICSEKLIIE